VSRIRHGVVYDVYVACEAAEELCMSVGCLLGEVGGIELSC
jgi:hypothetical protein